VSAFEVVAVIISIFFGLGIAMGVFLVMAFPAMRRYRYVKRHPEDEAWRLPPAPPEGGRPLPPQDGRTGWPYPPGYDPEE
jgi:hypothetical protein